jgi:hypothetical protein
MTTEIITFHDNDNDCQESAYDAVQRQVQTWLLEHPEAIYTTSHSTAIAGENGNYGGKWTEFSLTLVVTIPDVAPPTQTDLIATHPDSIPYWQNAMDFVDEHPAVKIQDLRDTGGSGWTVTVPVIHFERHAPSTFALLQLVTEAQDAFQTHLENAVREFDSTKTSLL